MRERHSLTVAKHKQIVYTGSTPPGLNSVRLFLWLDKILHDSSTHWQTVQGDNRSVIHSGRSVGEPTC